MSPKQTFYTDTKSVRLFFRENDETLKTLKFSLNEAVLQMASAIFTVRHLELEEFTEEHDDIFFVTYNVFNDFLEALRVSSKYYVEELYTRVKEKN